MLIQLILTAIALLAMWFTRRRQSQHALRPIEGWAWLVVWIALIVVVWRPEATSWLAVHVGIGRGADLMVYGSIVILFLLIFHLQVVTQRLERSVTDLVTAQALKDLPNDETSV